MTKRISMTDTIDLETGARPWLGRGSGQLTRTFDFYDIPLVGVIEQAAVSYLFRCLAGEVEPFNLWVYTLLTPSELAALDAIEEREAFDEAVDALMDRPGVIAAATEGHGLVAWGSFKGLDDVRVQVPAVLSEVEAWAQGLQEAAASQRHRLTLAG
jgi:hypothetical protein